MMLGGYIVYTKALRGVRHYDIESKISLVLKYYVIEKIMGSGESYYGVEVEEKKVSGEMQYGTAYDRLLLSESKEWVEELINKLIGFGVTPVTLDCVIDELVG